MPLSPEYQELLPELRQALLPEFYTELPPETGAERGAPAATGLAPGAHVGPYELIRTDSGVHLWSQTHDRDVKDIFDVQDEIADAVVAALKLKLLTAQVVDLHRSDNPEAYDQYLLGKQLGRRANCPTNPGR